MKDFPGTPGTLTGLLLRILQCLFAVGSIALMANTSSFFQYTAFCYLMASMALQVIWSFALACLDTYALARKAVLHNPILVTLFVVGDWVTATLTLAAAASSAGVIFLYTRDFGIWKGEECMKYQISVSLAFFSWIMVGISSLIMLWILGGG
ncbi:CASP-like protein 5B3 [Macadamia integrifolia]|uniref:CASP-like protein 5B3 n=1 Tax=Macadamia integrifolia TaxID=60698 RepID=UPI001C4F66B2|nr:CASP-like protein 5B3 [Macadamia integrifolia]